MRRWIGSWRRHNPGYAHRLYDDVDCLRYVRQRFPDWLDRYQSLTPVERADVWRYLIVYERGGVYADLDTICRAPVESWVRSGDEAVVGIDSDVLDDYPTWQPERFTQSGGGFRPHDRWRDHPVLFCQWSFAARPGHAILGDVIERVRINLADPYFLHEDPTWTVKKTGPGVFTDAFDAFLRRHDCDASSVGRALREEPELVIGGVRFLDFDALHFRLVRHLDMGSWKQWGALRRAWRWMRLSVAS
jgi:hypothetical protein